MADDREVVSEIRLLYERWNARNDAERAAVEARYRTAPDEE